MIPTPKHNAITAFIAAGLLDAPMLVPVFADVEAEPEAEPEAGFATVDVVIDALVPIDGAEEASVAVGEAILFVVAVDLPPAVAVVVAVVATCVSAVSEVETAAVEEGGEDATVS
jgi:hypothetical protein